jgi:hypothetical protein
MNHLLPFPFYIFIKMVIKNGGISIKRIKNVPSWLIKTILFEPFRWLELAFYQKSIIKHNISKDPVFILGFYRSGTSYLHEFFTQDDRIGYHTNFQMVFPDMMLICEKWLSPILEFICRIFNIHDPVHRTRLSFRFPGEEDGTMTTSLNPRGAAWGYFFPKKMREYFNKYVLFKDVSISEIEQWKQDYIFLVKKISFSNRNRQLVLKSPPNTARIKLLLSIYPNAKFIFIHRHPIQVYASNKRFLKVARSFYGIGKSGQVDFNSIILDIYSKTIQRYLEEKDSIPKGNLVEIAYEDFVKNPITYMKKIYENLQLEDFKVCENKMQAFAQRQKNFVSLNHKLHTNEKGIVTKNLEPMIKLWNYSL